MQGVTSTVRTDLEHQEAERPDKVNITLEGGSGKASIASPVTVTYKGGRVYATLVWSSKNYDYVIVDGTRYENENPGGNSTFTIPVQTFDEPLTFIGDTVAMSRPHEIEYTIIWNMADDDNNDQTVGSTIGSSDEKGENGENGAFGSRVHAQEEPIIDGIKKTGQMMLSHASGFDVFEYDDYRLVRIYGVGDYLLVPEGKEIPGDLPEGITPVTKPCDRTYLVSTSVADLIRQIGALDMIKLCALDTGDWGIKEVDDLMRDGDIVYAGKYRSPDYELLISAGCDLAIENTMIYHDPEVKEKLEELGIPVMVETSSYEPDPLGRLEWIKLYGTLYDKEDEAEAFFSQQKKRIGALSQNSSSGKKVAVFYVTTSGTVNVRTPGDYLTKMIELAGGEYIPDSIGALSSGGMGTVSMQLEDFYESAKDADILIYNSTIEGELSSIEDITGPYPVLSGFKAVKEGNVYCLSSDFFRKTTGMADFLTDMTGVLEGEDGPFTFLEKLR